MNYLFIHQNFPGQYRHIVQDLALEGGNNVLFITQPNDNSISGVEKVIYKRDTRAHVNCHVYSAELDRAIFTGATVADTCRVLARRGFRPDLVVGHGGWGETLFVKDVFPDAPILANFEYYYHARGADVGFDPEFSSIFNNPSRLRVRNGIHLLNAQAVDWGHSATRWQRSLHPPELQKRISVLHEGVDTEIVKPDDKAIFEIPEKGFCLSAKDEVITYVARNLEPYRGFHTFMRSLPTLLKRRRRAHVVIVGGDGVSYGAPPPPSSSYREMMLQEVGNKLDSARVHFLGHIEYGRYLKLLQVSSAHVYLTYPFVLSWSFVEAMASGCLVIASATPPVMEVMRDGRNGVATDFFSPSQLARRMEYALDDPREFRPLRTAARNTAVSHFDLRRRILPKWRTLFADLIGGGKPALTFRDRI